MINQQKAQDIANNYLADQLRERLNVTDVPAAVYNRDQYSNCWAVRVPFDEPEPMRQYDRFLFISKETGEIVFDGKVFAAET